MCLKVAWGLMHYSTLLTTGLCRVVRATQNADSLSVHSSISAQLWVASKGSEAMVRRPHMILSAAQVLAEHIPPSTAIPSLSSEDCRLGRLQDVSWLKSVCSNTFRSLGRCKLNPIKQSHYCELVRKPPTASRPHQRHQASGHPQNLVLHCSLWNILD